MRSRLILLSVIVGLAACGQPSSPEKTAPAAEAPAATPAARAASVPAADPNVPDPVAKAKAKERFTTWADAANAKRLDGTWHYSVQADGTNAKAVYVVGEFAVFTWVCDMRGGILGLISDVELAPDQATGFGMIIPDARYIFAARSEGAGTDFPIIAADVTLNDPRLDAIADSADGFAFQVAGYTTRIPGDPMLKRVLADCRK